MWWGFCGCLSFFFLAGLLLLLVLVLLTTSVLKQRKVPATVSCPHVSVLYTAMLRTSIAAVVLCCFYLCPLDCDASVIVVDCAAVETGCMLEKYHKSPFLRIRYFQCCFRCVYSIAVAAVEKGYTFLFFGGGAAATYHLTYWLRCCCWWCLCYYNTSTEAERGTGCCFFLPPFYP